MVSKEIIKARNKAYGDANRARLNAYAKEYRDNNKQRISDYHKAYREENKEKRANVYKIWLISNRHKKKEAQAKRRALKNGYTGAHYTNEDVCKLLDNQMGLCAYCNVLLDSTYQVDHVIPIAKGGGNGADNIAICCSFCNASKGCKILYESWIPPKHR